MSQAIFKRCFQPVRHVGLWCLIGLLSSCGGGSNNEQSSSQASPTAFGSGATDQIIVKPASADLIASYNTRAAEFASALSADAGLPLIAVRQTHDGSHVLALPAQLPASDVARLAAGMMKRADVQYAEPDLILQPTAIPSDPAFSKLWGLREPSAVAGGINAVDAWDVSTGDANLVVAVVDTGVLLHNDFGGRVLPGYDFVSNVTIANDGTGRDTDARDAGDWLTVSEAAQLGRTAKHSSWHGTHVAGTIGALGNNGIGVTGVNWQSRILPVRVLGKGGGYTSDIADGIAWAGGASVPGVPNNPTPARVVNLSLGGGGACSQTTQNAINAALTRSAVVVVAAGNDALNVSGSQPANCAGVIAVAAVGAKGQRASYSNYGAGITLAAPGGDPEKDSGILSLGDAGETKSLNDNSLLAEYGTSMAAPHVSGAVSLVLSVNPALSPAEVKSLLLSTARAFPIGTGRDCNTSTCGAGILDAGAAVRAAASAVAGVTAAVPQSGVWWNPTEPGRGYVIEVQDGKLNFGAYLYDETGRASWYLSSGAMQSSYVYNGTLESYSGGQSLSGIYKAPTGRTSKGQVSIQFHSQTTATLSWPGGTVAIQRFRFGAGSVSKFAPQAGVWWNPQESGRGYAFEVQDGTFSMSAFMYDSAGNPVWYLAAGPLSSSNTFTGSLVQYANGQTLTGSYKVPTMSNAAAGTISVRFVDTATAVMTLPNGQPINVEKLRVGSAGPGVVIPVNQVLTARLIGIWRISYRIISTFTDYFLFNEVRESSIEPGTYNVWGINQYDTTALGGWTPSLGRYTIFAPGPLFDDFYVFDMPAFDSINGCYYLAYRNPTRLSSCYALTATKLADIAPLDVSARLIAPQLDLNSRNGLMAKESAQLAAPVVAAQGIGELQAPVLARIPEVDRLIRDIETRRSQLR
jgi:serine protease